MKFSHILRYQIAPGHFEEERIRDLVDYCKKYGFSDVTFFLSAEEYNLGHITLEEAKPRVKSIIKAAKILRKNGILVSLNPWMEVGHLDRNKPLKDSQQDWTMMVDYNGKTSQSCVCMLDEKWRAYFKELYTYVLKELSPNIVWVEDDFRMHNHTPLTYGGCFCEKHMKLYNDCLKSNYTREQFVDKLFKKEYDANVKKAWMETSRAVMNNFAQFLGETYRSCGKDIRVGLMSSKHTEHAVEMRDWYTIHKNLSGNHAPINRLHMPCYEEIASKDYYREFFLYPFMLRALLPEDCIIYPELENSAFNSFGKEPKFLQFQLEGALPLQIEGMTYDIFGFVGNGPKENVQYCETIKQITPYLESVMELIDYQQLDGVRVPMDELTAYHRENIQDFHDFYPDEHYFYGFLGTAGIPCKPTTKKTWVNEIVALSSGAVNNFSDEQLVQLFKDNYIILEGRAVEKLLQRGLGWLIHVKSASLCKSEWDPQSHEELVGDDIIDSIKGYRASSYCRAGDYIKIEYDRGIELKSIIRDYKGDYFGSGIADGGNFMIIPYVFEPRILYEQFNRLRLSLLKNFLKKTGKELIMSEYPGIYAYLYEREKDKILILVNSTVSSFSKILLSINGFSFNNIWVIDKVNGSRKEVPFCIEHGQLSIDTPLEYMSTMTFILKK